MSVFEVLVAENESMMSENVPEDGITIQQLLKVVVDRFWLIFILVVLGLGAAIGYLYITVPQYETSVTALVSPLTNSSDLSSLLGGTTSTRKITTEVQLIKSSQCISSALDSLDLSRYLNSDGVPYSQILSSDKPDKIKSKITTEVSGDTNLVTITVTDSSPAFCQDFANAIAESFSTLLTGIAKNSKSAQRLFLEEQIPQNEELLREASDELAAFQEKTGYIQVSQKSTALTQNIFAYQMRLEPLVFQRVEHETICKDAQAAFDAASVPYPSFEDVMADESAALLSEDLLRWYTELFMYANTDEAKTSSADTNRVFFLESSVSSASRSLSDLVQALVLAQAASSDAAVAISRESYSKAITQMIIIDSQVNALKNLQQDAEQQLTAFPSVESRFQELTRSVQVYEALSIKLREMLEEAKLLESAVSGNVTIIDSAVLPVTQVSPRTLIVIAAGILAGGALGFLLALLIELTDRTVRTPDVVNSIVGPSIPILGWTPLLEVPASSTPFDLLFTYRNPSSSLAENYKLIANNIFYSSRTGAKILAVNSTLMSEGKSTLTSNLAVAFAQQGKRVLIIDGDLRRPNLEGFFNLKKSAVGLTDCIVTKLPLQDAIIQPFKELPGLHALFSGKTSRNPAAIFSSPAFASLMEQFRSQYDFIIIDVPPLGFAAEFATIVKLCDEVVVSIRAGITTKDSLASLISNIRLINGVICGYVLNQVVSGTMNDRYGYSGYYSYGRYGAKKYGYYYGYNKQSKSDLKAVRATSGSIKSVYGRHYKKDLINRRQALRFGANDPVLAASGQPAPVKVPRPQGGKRDFLKDIEQASLKKPAKDK